jgi:gamma-glutamyltranspeptidase/glutathione hydrolase
MVSAAHPLAARAGVETMRRGGNAIDALVTVQLVLNLVEPQSSGIGGGCFLLFFEASSGKVLFLDGREEVPAACRREDFLGADGKVLDDDLTGGLPVGVPGTLAAIGKAHRRWGKLPWEQVVEPATRLAETGVGVTPRLRLSILVNRQRFLRFPASRDLFLRGEEASAPEIGEVLRQADLAQTLRLVSRHGPDVFYRGEIARDLVRSVQSAPYRPGKLTLEDLHRYQAVEREPIRFRYRDYEIVSAPPPSSGGITLGLMLGILQDSDIRSCKSGSVEELELLARAGAAAFADRNAYLADQDWNPHIPMRALLAPEYVRQRTQTALSFPAGQRCPPGPLLSAPGQPLPSRDGPDTTHFSIVDPERNVVACTSTIEHGMGCGLVVEGRGFLLNNQLTDFDLDVPDSPNSLDPTPRRRRTAVDAPESLGGKRPRSSMTPVIVLKNGKPYLTLGSPGGPLIIGTVAQILVNVLDHGMDLQQAINAPRISSRNGPLELEALYPQRDELVRQLEQRGWQVARLSPLFEVWGGAHGIRLLADGWLEGGADPRREGAVRGW